MTPEDEAAEFLNALATALPPNLDGRGTILAMQQAGARWRDMEWIGFGFEHLARSLLAEQCHATVGPHFGRTQFDVQRAYVWDLKAHPIGAGGPILNDREAMDLCAAQFHGVGFIIAEGDTTYDEDGIFKAWHDALKGGISAYERTRIERNARSRRRKTAFNIASYEAFWFPSATSLQAAVAAGTLSYFQEGMRNSNGMPRRPKYQVRDMSALRNSSALVARRDL